MALNTNAGINTDDDTLLYHYAQPQTEDYVPSMKAATDANDKLLLDLMKEGPERHSITLVENHQETLKDDPTLVQPVLLFSIETAFACQG